MYERFQSGEGAISRQVSDPRDDFALKEYNLAINLLLEPFRERKSAPLDVCLMACILFACFEVSWLALKERRVRSSGANSIQTIQGNYGSAIAHVSKILGIDLSDFAHNSDIALGSFGLLASLCYAAWHIHVS